MLAGAAGAVLGFFGYEYVVFGYGSFEFGALLPVFVSQAARRRDPRLGSSRS